MSGESQTRELQALRVWYADERAQACVVYGSVEADKGAVIEHFLRETGAPGVQQVMVRVGRVQGAPFEQDVLAAIAAALWPEEAPFMEDLFGLRERLLNHLANRDQENDDAPLLLSLVDLDACLDWPEAARASVVASLGPAVRVVVAITGERDAGEAWSRRLGLGAEDVTLVGVDAETWRAFDLGSLRLVAASLMAWCSVQRETEIVGLLSLVSRALAPLELVDVASVLGRSEAEVRALIEAHRDSLSMLVTWEGEALRAIRFTHEAFCTVWEEARDTIEEAVDPLDAMRDAAAFHHADPFAEAARRFVLSRIARSDEESDGGTYLRRFAGDHWRLSMGQSAEFATPEGLAALSDPRWAWPSTRSDLAARRAELRRARGLIAEPSRFLAPSGGVVAAMVRLVETGIAQGVLGTLHEQWTPGERRPCSEALEGADCALAMALLALAVHAHPHDPGETMKLGSQSAVASSPGGVARPLRHELIAQALALAVRGGAGWQAPQALLLVARAASEVDASEAAEFARRALALVDTRGEALSFSDWLAAVDLVPVAEAEPLVEKTLAELRSRANPGRWLARLGSAEGLSTALASRLFRLAMDLPPASRANALAPLLGRLPAEARERALSVMFEAFFEGEDAGDEGEAGGEGEFDGEGEAGGEEAALEDGGDAGELLDHGACTEALAPFLNLAQVVRLRGEAMGGMGEPLARRFAELGETGDELETIDTLCGGGVDGARALLRAASTPGGRALVSAAQGAVAALTPAWVAASLVRDQAEAALQVLGLDQAVALAERGGDEASLFGRITALVALCRVASEALRPGLATRVVAAYRDDPGSEGLESVMRCAPWMALEDAAWLLSVSLGDAAGAATLVSTLSGWGGVEMLAPVVARLGGDEAVDAVAAAAQRQTECWAEMARVRLEGDGSTPLESRTSAV
ncbi:hypothetical protein [Chondromyces crocatus]|uniref:hypothetical protein n=1 Tax=Chondromyces crocatus TaxID=52 RepID=UPI00067B6537|nr:hypothetical protein [Chondromyces crocatus]